MNLRQEKMEDMAKDILIEQNHERLMVEDEEYFTTWTIENFDIAECIDLLDVMNLLNPHLANYGWQFSDICKAMKEK